MMAAFPQTPNGGGRMVKKLNRPSWRWKIVVFATHQGGRSLSGLPQ
jgi:hypothetical protein